MAAACSSKHKINGGRAKETKTFWNLVYFGLLLENNLPNKRRKSWAKTTRKAENHKRVGINKQLLQAVATFDVIVCIFVYSHLIYTMKFSTVSILSKSSIIWPWLLFTYATLSLYFNNLTEKNCMSDFFSALPTLIKYGPNCWLVRSRIIMYTAISNNRLIDLTHDFRLYKQ